MNVKAIREFVEANQPVGLEKLAVASTVPFHTISRLIRIRRAPNHLVQEKISEALQKTVDEVFPVVKRKTA